MKQSYILTNDLFSTPIIKSYISSTLIFLISPSLQLSLVQLFQPSSSPTSYLSSKPSDILTNKLSEVLSIKLSDKITNVQSNLLIN